jgi:hypothetical protein
LRLAGSDVMPFDLSLLRPAQREKNMEPPITVPITMVHGDFSPLRH